MATIVRHLPTGVDRVEPRTKSRLVRMMHEDVAFSWWSRLLLTEVPWRFSVPWLPVPKGSIKHTRPAPLSDGAPIGANL